MPTTQKEKKPAATHKGRYLSAGDKIYRELYLKVFPFPSEPPHPGFVALMSGLLVGAATALEAVDFDYDREVPLP